ncbi:protein of unknown function [Burkholderia sp. D7]|nr:protein of unknown function [Burkholderia sp. D7]
MKTFSRMMVGALLGVWCGVLAFAQPPSKPYDPSAPKTRAEVKADLIEWLAAGYDPNDWVDYPDNALRTRAIVSARRAQAVGSPSAQ